MVEVKGWGFLHLCWPCFILLSTIFNPHISDFYFPQTMPIQYPILFKYPLAALIVVRLLSHVQLLVTSWTAAHLGPLSYAISRSLLKLVHWFRDAIQLSNPLSLPSSPALNLSQHQGLFTWVSSPHHVAKVLEFQLQHQSLQWTRNTNLL